MKIIENTTPYKGRIKIKIERSSPYYTTGKSSLNKLHFKLFGFYVSSRLFAKRDENGDKILNPKKVELIETFTGGHIAKYQDVANMFLDKNGFYVGDAERGWWYYKNHLKIDSEYPHGVAEVWSDDWSKQIGYYGYTHRGGQTFKIGDKLFDASYEPNEAHFEEWEWAGWELELEKSEYSDSIIDFIPFTRRGSKTIENFAEAKEAARNMSNYLD